MKQLSLILIVLCGLLLTGCNFKKKTTHTGAPKNDADFAKEAFQLLADGDEAVADMLDWEHLSLINIDAGALYSKISDEKAREEFRKSFIESYSSSFKRSGGSPAVLSNWHEQSRNGSETVVAADGPNGKVLLMTVAHIDGEQKISKLELQ